MKLDLTIEQYHEDKTAISSSAFYYLSKCPAYYQAYKQGSFNKDAAYFRIGSAVHTRILEPQKYEKEFIVMPKIDGRTTEGKELKQKFQEESEGKIVLTDSEHKQISSMVDSVFQHQHAVELLSRGGEPEVSLFWWEPLFYRGLPTIGCHVCGYMNPFDDPFGDTTTCEACDTELRMGAVWSKTRPDYISDDTIIDVKTTKSISGFQNSINTFLYDSQAAFQLAGATNEGYHINEYYWIVVEKEPPYLTAVLKARPETLHAGRERYQNLLQIYNKALATNNWYAYPDIIEI